MKEIEKQIREVLDKTRGYLQEDGGDLQFVKFEDGIVYVAMLGACTSCSSKSSTIDDVIERTLLAEVAGVIGVEAI
jgi:Fe-S cluster biogenesis protein NfuA